MGFTLCAAKTNGMQTCGSVGVDSGHGRRVQHAHRAAGEARRCLLPVTGLAWDPSSELCLDLAAASIWGLSQISDSTFTELLEVHGIRAEDPLT